MTSLSIALSIIVVIVVVVVLAVFLANVFAKPRNNNGLRFEGTYEKTNVWHSNR